MVLELMDRRVDGVGGTVIGKRGLDFVFDLNMFNSRMAFPNRFN